MRAAAIAALAILALVLALGIARVWSDPLYQADSPPRLIFPRRDM